MTREHFEEAVGAKLAEIQAMWNEFTDEDAPLCISVFHTSYSFFALTHEEVEGEDNHLCNLWVDTSEDDS